jgi:hypothetical protein
MTIRNDTRTFPPVDVRALLECPFRRCAQDVRADVVAEGVAFDPLADLPVRTDRRAPQDVPILVGEPDAWRAFDVGDRDGSTTQVVVRPAYRPGFGSTVLDEWTARICDWLAAPFGRVAS